MSKQLLGMIAAIGCSLLATAQALPCNTLIKRHISYYDTLQQTTVTRPYYIYLPKQICENKTANKHPVLFGLHGYMGTASGFALSTTEGTLNHLANEHDWIMVYPQGMTAHHQSSTDHRKDVFYSSWNFLPAKLYNASFQSDVVTNSTGSYPMCNLKKMHHNPIPQQPGCRSWKNVCGWTSCYDDARYLLAIQHQVARHFSGDLTRQYLVGISNGAMMAYRMVCQYPGRFQSAVAIGGTTARGITCSKYNVAPSSQQTSLLLLFGINDTAVPMTVAQQKKATNNLYYYALAKNLVAAQAKRMGCQKKQRIQKTILDGVNCVQYSQCQGKSNSVAYCIWGERGHTINHGHTYPGTTKQNGWCVNEHQQDVVKDYPACEKTKPSDATEETAELIYRWLTQNKV
jgi:poly(3-hydroxybutyrate) depolymerase